MSRRISTQKRFPEKDYKYDNLLVSILVNKILKSGKKRLARRIVYKAFELIEFRTGQSPMYIFEKALRNISPSVQVKAKRVGGATHQVPVLLSKYSATHLAIKWLVGFSRKRSGKGITIKLASEMIDGAKGIGSSVKKREETHKIAESNKAYTQIR
uniref:Ribosomal protein S7 n=1 Tax=Pedospumella sp. Jangsampo120217C5 TaxID=2782409 RepID=A0A7S6PV09_9STRA|nr:ribosomal protein S7 [Pedospumella sp. Jangsampo120217C5]|tara:strand:- start:130 stop:597 length:468 start_codon:yes stop_codon:yes gene_type:complete